MGEGRSGNLSFGSLRRTTIFPSVDISVIVADVDNNNFLGDVFVCGGLLGLC